MLDLKVFEKDPEAIAQRLERRGSVAHLSELLEHIKTRKRLVQVLQVEQEQRNQESKALAKATKEEIDQKRDQLKALTQGIKEKEAELRQAEEALQDIALRIPNVPRDDVPFGQSADDNVEVRKVGTPRTFDFTPQDHVAIAEQLGIVDFARAAKVSGSRFAFLKKQGSQLNRALQQFMTDFHVNQGDTELTVPYMVLDSAMEGTGQFPNLKEDTFEVRRSEAPLYLIPTAEVPVTNYFRDEILDEEMLPARFCAYSACFRAEAGAAGKDTRGLIRQHQFEKVEMVRFATPDQADDELTKMVERASTLLSLLKLPHRVMLLCTGDMGFTSEKTYDLEVWLPGQDCYREVSSCSVFGTFQSRRAQIRFRHKSEGGKPGKIEPLVTLNGSGLPLGRVWVAILENHQNADGSVDIPEVLWPYMNGIKKLVPNESA